MEHHLKRKKWNAGLKRPPAIHYQGVILKCGIETTPWYSLSRSHIEMRDWNAPLVFIIKELYFGIRYNLQTLILRVQNNHINKDLNSAWDDWISIPKLNTLDLMHLHFLYWLFFLNWSKCTCSTAKGTVNFLRFLVPVMLLHRYLLGALHGLTM